ncbi:hypothetical protein C8D98_1237, partial [Seleniivibrio woodruffii]
MIKSLLTTFLLMAATFSAFADEAPAPDTGDTAWLLVSAAFVLLMLPG